MNSKMIGAIFVILGCGSFGFSMAAAYRREERQLMQLMSILEYLQCELKYHLTPLPQLCYLAAKQGRGGVYELFGGLSEVLRQGNLPQVSDCIYAVMSHGNVTPSVRELLLVMGQTLGQFDLEGQLMGLKSLQQRCEHALEVLRQGKTDRLRSYQTLGLCAGAALVILFV